MKSFSQNLVTLALALLLPSVVLVAEDVDQAEIEEWIKQLDADSLTKRQTARRELTEAGQNAIPALTKAALSDKREVIVYSIDILSDIAKSSDQADTQQAATVALEMLSESDKPSTAQRAKTALDAKKGSGIQAFPGWDKPGSEFAGNGRAANRSVSVSNINGIKTITVRDAGKTTTLQDQPSGAIRVQTTVDGKPKEFLAKDLDELKKKDPEAHALYTQHSGNARGMNFFGVRGFGQNGVFGNGANMAQVPANPRALDINAAGAGFANQMMIQHLTELKRRMAGNPQMQQLLDQQIKELNR